MPRSRLKKIISIVVALLIVAGGWLQRSRFADVPSGVRVESSVSSDSSDALDAMPSNENDPEIDASPSDNGQQATDNEQQTTNNKQSSNATVLHVVDGDTFDADLDDVGKVRIRMLGVNTPETVDPRKTVECFGKEASDFSKKTLKIGDRIFLAPDPQADERDKYGRLLRNVFLADGTDYNALLIQEGFAYAYLGFPLDPKRKVQLRALENEAKSAKKGLWGSGCD